MVSNTENNKTIAKNTFYLYLRLIVSMLIGLKTSRAILEALGVEDYGIYNIVAGFVSMLSLFTGAITSAAQRFITYELGTGNVYKLRRTFSTFTTLLIIFSLIIIALSFVSGKWLVTEVLNIPVDRIYAAINVFYCSSIAFCVNVIAAPYIACVTAHERMNFYALVSVGDSLLRLLIVLLLYITPFDLLEIYAILIVIVGIISRLIYGLYCKKHFEETRFKFLIDINILKEIWSFSLWVIFGGSAMIAKEQGVNMLINRFFGVTMNAARGVSMQVFSILNQFSNSIATAINPQITKSYAAGNLLRSIRLTFVSTKAQGVMLLLISLPLYIEIDYVLGLWLKNVPYYASDFARWVIIICFVSTMRQTYGPLYLATGKVRFLEIVGGFIILLNLPISYVVLKMGGQPVSTMVVNVLLEIVCMFACFGYMKKLLDFPTFRFYKNVIVPIIITMLITYFAASFIKEFFSESFIRLVIICIVSTITTSVFSYFLIFEKSERDLLKSVIIKKFV